MKSLSFLALLIMFINCAPVDEPIHKYRPEFHFTPQENWMNDPNGMFYDDGVYHLYYQYNPYGDRWGHMSWGHATSTDLVSWEHHPVALLEEDSVMIFSGSMVVDRDNTSGFGNDDNYPIVAIYTGYDEANGIQRQDIAYSLDGGYTFTKYEGNPVIDLNMKDFRDPKVFWHEETMKWVMVVALSADQKLQFYSSQNLIDWDLLSEWGPAGAASGLWECPDLFEIAVDGDPTNTRWVLEIDLGTNSNNPGSGGQYFIGDFDGVKFTLDESYNYPIWIDHGHDFYAAVTWFNWDKTMPTQWLSWANNWNYAQDIPTEGWRSMMSLARDVELKTVGEKILLYQPVVETYQLLREENISLDEVSITEDFIFDEDVQQIIQTGRFETQIELNPTESYQFDVRLEDGKGGYFNLNVDEVEGKITFQRAESDAGFEGEIFELPQVITLDENVEVKSLLIIYDKSIVEIFINGGLYTFTNQMFIESSASIMSISGELIIDSINFWSLGSAL